MFLAGKSPNIRSYTVYIYGTGQRCEYNAESTSLGLAHVYPCVFVFAGDCPGHVGTLATLLGVSVCICVPPVALDTWAPWPRCLACLCAFVCRRLHWTRGHLGHVACDPTTISVDLVSVGCFGAMML